MSNKLEKIIIATGGTGGHIFPAYSLAKHFIDSKKINVQIISDKRGLKYLKEYNDLKIIEINSSTIFKKNIFYVLFSILSSVSPLSWQCSSLRSTLAVTSNVPSGLSAHLRC